MRLKIVANTDNIYKYPIYYDIKLGNTFIGSIYKNNEKDIVYIVECNALKIYYAHFYSFVRAKRYTIKQYRKILAPKQWTVVLRKQDNNVWYKEYYVFIKQTNKYIGYIGKTRAKRPYFVVSNKLNISNCEYNKLQDCRKLLNDTLREYIDTGVFNEV